MSIFHDILENYWGYSSFRPLQEDIINSVYNGKDTLGLMPTGGGKSITFQVPAMAMDGICIVVTPLIALMKDQVDNLRKRGIKALAVYSGMQYQEILTAYDNAVLGDFKFLYISPERLNTSLFIQKLQAMKVSMLVIDEAHCISQWGYDFRPAYLNIVKIRPYICEKAPILALTATATKDVIEDIQNQLYFRAKNLFSKSFERKNITYSVKNVEDKVSELCNILNKTNGCTLIYVRNRNKTKEVSDILNSQGFVSDYFHAGLSSYDKILKQENWKSDKVRIMVCTNAFGMGIDKPDVRLVIHIDLPNSIEEYFQEAGRAGRDEKSALALILKYPKDINTLKKRVVDSFPERDFIKKVYENLCYFFQVAEGFGQNEYFKFNIYTFVHTYKLSVQQTHHALKILTLAGYIDYQDNVDNKSRIEIIITRQEMYLFDLSDIESDILNYILRKYTGIFSDFIPIDEVEISHKLNYKRKDVYNILISLAKRKIISYIPASQEPLIGFQLPRQDMKYIYLSKEVYNDRLTRYRERIGFVCEYVTQKVLCRSRFLLNYFGEKTTENCGTCDICKERNKTLNEKIFTSIKESILKIIEKHKELELSHLILQLNEYEEEDIVQVLRIVLDQESINFNGLTLSLTKKTDSN